MSKNNVTKLINEMYPKARRAAPSAIVEKNSVVPTELIEFYSKFDVSKIELMFEFNKYGLVEISEIIECGLTGPGSHPEIYSPFQERKYLKNKSLDVNCLPENSIKIAKSWGVSSFYVDIDPDILGVPGQIFFFDQEGGYNYICDSMYSFLELVLGCAKHTIFRIKDFSERDVTAFIEWQSFEKKFVKIPHIIVENSVSPLRKDFEFRCNSSIKIEFNSIYEEIKDRNEVFGILSFESGVDIDHSKITLHASARSAFIYLYLEKYEAWDNAIRIDALLGALESCGIADDMVSLDMDHSAWVFLTQYEGTFLRSIDHAKWISIFGKGGLPYPRQSLVKKIIWGIEKYVPRRV